MKLNMEDIFYEKKSLKLFSSKDIDWKELAKDCVCFANSKGGIINIGIEDSDDMPPSEQKYQMN